MGPCQRLWPLLKVYGSVPTASWASSADSSIGLALLATRAPTANRDACQAFARSFETWRQMQAQGPLMAASAAALQRVEAQMARCRNASVQGK